MLTAAAVMPTISQKMSSVPIGHLHAAASWVPGSPRVVTLTTTRSVNQRPRQRSCL